MAIEKVAQKVTMVRVKANTMVWNGSCRIREGTVFDYPLKEGASLPRWATREVEKKEATISVGKRSRDDAPTNTGKD